MVSMRGNNESLNIKQFMIGDKYAEALGSGLKLSVVNKLNLAQNRLHPSGGLKVLQGLNFGVRELDLSNNRLGETQACIEHLATIIKDRRYHIEKLILDSNKLGDAHVQVLAEALMISSYKPLKVLSLGENQIGDVGIEAIAEMLDVNSTGLKELRLLWNNITSKGGNKLADSLKSNSQLRVLDLSWNALGSGSSPGEVGN